MAVQETTYDERDAVSLAEAATERFDTIVIGGGQAGLAMGYHLKKQGRPFVVLDANERIGGSWRTRTWHSLQCPVFGHGAARFSFVAAAAPACPATAAPEALATRMAIEGTHFATQLKSAEAREAFAAFAEKRAPDFSKI